MDTGRRRSDLIGQRFGRLVVESLASPGKKNIHAKWQCICDCGEHTVVPTNGLRSGNNTQCFTCARKSQSKKITGANNGRWLGGKSFGKYCYKFNMALKEEIRDKFNHTCYICGKKESSEKLCVHHIDYNKVQGCQGMKWSLIPLCKSCHAKTNNNRWYWFNRLICYWAEPYLL